MSYVQYDIHHASMVDFCLQCITSEKFNTTSETVVVYLPDSTFTGVVKNVRVKECNSNNLSLILDSLSFM